MQKRLSVEEAHDYWRQPADENNLPERYLQEDSSDTKSVRSKRLVRLFREHAEPDDKILEVGCNSGRNLDYLRRAGFSKLSGIEISENAVELMRRELPKLYKTADIHIGPAEEILSSFPDCAFDVIYTMATLVHIPTESSWVFPEMARCAKSTIITIELERTSKSDRHFGRLYKPIFAACGFEEVATIDPYPGLPGSYIGRVFKAAKIW